MMIPFAVPAGITMPLPRAGARHSKTPACCVAVVRNACARNIGKYWRITPSVPLRRREAHRRGGCRAVAGVERMRRDGRAARAGAGDPHDRKRMLDAVVATETW